MATAHEGAPLLNQLRGSVPREKLVNLECSRVYEADTARVTICVSFFVAAVYYPFPFLSASCNSRLAGDSLGSSFLWEPWRGCTRTYVRPLLGEPGNSFVGHSLLLFIRVIPQALFVQHVFKVFFFFFFFFETF